MTAVAFVVALVVTLRQVQTTFNITANTELARIVSDSLSMPAWQFPLRAAAYDQNGKRHIVREVQFAPAITIRVERVSLGPLRIVASGSDTAQIVAVLVDSLDMPVTEIHERLVLTVPVPPNIGSRGLVIVMPFRGRVDLGSAGSTETQAAMLRSGSVSILGRSALGSSRFEAGTSSLDPGDRFFVEHQYGPAIGFIRLDERPALTIVYRVLATKGLIARFGSRGYTLGASMRDRLLKDRVLQGVWLTTVALVGLARKLSKHHAS
jgi:hypothetical protein